MASEVTVHGNVHGERGGVAAGRDVVAQLVSTGDHASFFTGGYQPLNDAYIDNWSVFERVRVDHFVGRGWLESEVDRFIAQNDRGYFILEAQAGLGKSAFLAHLVRERGWISHFAELAPGESGAVAGRMSLAAQVMRTFELDNAAALPDAAARPDFLANLLRKAAARLTAGEKLVIVVDGLDEAGTLTGENVLGLPRILPARVFFVVSKRPVPVTLDVETPRRVFSLEAGSKENVDDVRAYLRGSGQADELVESLVTKSRGVWIYLRYVLDEMAGGQELDLENLPDGLWRYYARFWRRWKESHEDSWYDVDLPLLSTLAATREEVGLGLLCALAGLEKLRRFEAILREKWRPFIAFQRGADPSFRLYHRSLEDFLHGRVDEGELTQDEAAFSGEVGEATRRAHNRIAGRYLSAWGGLEAGLPGLVAPATRELDGGYGLRHLASHLAEAHAGAALYALIGKAWMEAHFAWSSSPDAFARDVEIAIRAAQAEDPPNYYQEARCSLIYAGIGSIATKTPPEVLGALARIGQLGRAVGYARLIYDNERRSTAYLLIAQAIHATATAKAQGLLSDALGAALAVPWPPDRADALARLGQGALEIGEVTFAVETAEHLVRAAEPDWIAPRKVRSLEQAVRIYIGAGRTGKGIDIADDALALVDQVTELRWEAAAAQVAIAATLDRAGQPERAQQIVDAAAGVLAENSGDYVNPNEHVRLVVDVGRLGDLESARTLAEGLWGWYLPMGRIEVAAAHLRAGGRAEAETTLDSSVAAVRTLLGENASEFTWMADQKQQCLRALTRVCADAGRLDDAQDFARAMDDPNDRAAALGIVALRAAALGSPGRGEPAELIEEAMKLAEQESSDEWKARERAWRHRDTVRQMVRISAQRGELAEARSFAGLLPEKADQVDALGDISAAHLAGNRRDAAMAVAREAVRLAELIKPDDYGEAASAPGAWGMTGAEAKAEENGGTALVSASRVVLRAGLGEEALAVCRRAYAVVDGMRDPSIWQRLVGDALANLAEAGDDAVGDLVQAVRARDPVHADGYALTVACGAARGGNTELALRLIRGSADDSPAVDRVISLAVVIESLAERDENVQAAAIAEEALSAARAIEPPWERSQAFGSLARPLAAAGLAAEAGDAAGEAARAADALCGEGNTVRE